MRPWSSLVDSAPLPGCFLWGRPQFKFEADGFLSKSDLKSGFHKKSDPFSYRFNQTKPARLRTAPKLVIEIGPAARICRAGQSFCSGLS